MVELVRNSNHFHLEVPVPTVLFPQRSRRLLRDRKAAHIVTAHIRLYYAAWLGVELRDLLLLKVLLEEIELFNLRCLLAEAALFEGLWSSALQFIPLRGQFEVNAARGLLSLVTARN